MMRVYIAEVAEGEARLEVTGDEAHHLTRVVRVRVGESVSVFDGGGREWSARVDTVGRQTVGLLLDGPVTPVPEPPVVVTLAIGVLKGDQMDAVIRDATVMGVSTVVPLATDHVTVPARAWRDDGAAARWHRVAVAAAKQCGRAVVPTVAPVTPFDRVWEQVATTGGTRLVLACVEPVVTGREVFSTADWRTLPRPAEVLVLVGPEGGWSPAELALMADRQVHTVSLGPRTLRAESVPAVALSVVWATWGWV